MRRINISIEEDVYSELRMHMSAKGLAQSAYGIVDSFMVRLIEAIEANQESKHFEFRKKPQEGDYK